MIPCLGVDPGSLDGAAVLLHEDRKTVLGWWVWTKLKRKGGDVFRVRAALTSPFDDVQRCLNKEGEVARFRDFQEAWVWWRYPIYQLVIEGLFIGRRDGTIKLQEILTLAESVGEFRAGLEPSPLPELRPLSREWRPQAAGIPARTPRAKAEALAIAKAERYFVWPESETPLTKAERGARAEAAWIASWGIAQRRYHPELREALAKLEG